MNTADITNYKQRVDTGKLVEKQIVANLRKQGVKFTDPTEHEDMTDKIDGWIQRFEGLRPVQIKYREGGDDIIFEIIKDIDHNLPGRDMQSIAEFYLVVNTLGEGRLFKVAEIKDLARRLLAFYESVKDTTSKDRWNHTAWELKVTVDRAHGNRKLMGYFSPKAFTVVQMWENLKSI